jgi:hypothetical protein
MGIKHKVRSSRVSWSKLQLSQKISVLFLLAMMLALPLTVLQIMNPRAVLTPFASSDSVSSDPSSVTGSGNSTPVLVTTEVMTASLEQAYNYDINGYDQDIGNELGMSISNLPPGLRQGKCKSSTNRREGVKEISCVIEGVPSFSGSFLIDVLLTDNLGARTSRTLTLQVK